MYKTGEIAKQHKEQLAGQGLLSSCSVRFIKFFYKEILSKSHSILLYEVDESDHFTEFVYFTANKEKYFKRISLK